MGPIEPARNPFAPFRGASSSIKLPPRRHQSGRPLASSLWPLLWPLDPHFSLCARPHRSSGRPKVGL